MKLKSYLHGLLILFILSSNSVFSQKPIPNASLEIKLPAEDESYHFNGNKRILNRTQYPVAIYQENFKLNAAQPEAMAKQYLFANKVLLGLTDFDINNNLILHHTRIDDGGTIVRFRQFYKGIAVNNNAEITIHINIDNTVDYVMNGFRYGIDLTNITPSVSAAAARQMVVNYLGITGMVSFESNKLMVLQHNGQHYLVYKVLLVCDQPVGEWDAFVNAQSGIILKVEDAAAYHNKKGNGNRKKRSPDKVLVNGTGNVFKPDPLTTATAVYGGSYVDGSDANASVLTAQLMNVSLLDITLSAGVYSLVGPYAEIRDFEAPNKGLFTQASSAFNFDRNADGFEAVNTYYHIDAAMRYLNTTAGVAVMPYQYVGGVRFDPSGLSGADNSHYLSGSGSLAFGEGGVDDAEDADVIIHELGHGIHDWITSGGLSQVNGLSEGTGDYFAGSYSRNIGIWPPANAAYNWTFNWDGHNPFWAGRVLNYAAVYPGGLVSQIHTDGQIWATANMKIWDDIGRLKADKVFWKGLSMTNSSSSQNDAANAVFTMSGTLGYTNSERQAIHTRYTAAGYTLPSFSPLPVKMLSFSAEKQNSSVLVKWSVANETQGNIYTIEKSADGSNFTSMQQFNAIANNRVNNYTATDDQPFAGINYYRLKETSLSGQVTYSYIIAINFNKKQLLEVYPNPARDFVKISCSGLKGNTVLAVTDINGKIVMQKTFNNITALTDMIDVSGFSAGIYQVSVMNNGNVVNKKMTITK